MTSLADTRTTTYADKLSLARQPTCPSSFLDLFASQCRSEDYSLCEALLLNQGLSPNALQMLLTKKPAQSDELLQLLAVGHPNLIHVPDKTQLLSLCPPARSMLLARDDLTTELITALCLDPEHKIRSKAQLKLNGISHDAISNHHKR